MGALVNGHRRSTFERKAREWQAEAAWYAKIASEQQSPAYQRVAASAHMSAWFYLAQLVGVRVFYEGENHG